MKACVSALHSTQGHSESALQDLKFLRGGHGKPELELDMLPKRAKFIDFNLTDASGLLAVAVSSGVRIGIDCERWDRVPSYPPERIAKRWMNAAEHEQLLGTHRTILP